MIRSVTQLIRCSKSVAYRSVEKLVTPKVAYNYSVNRFLSNSKLSETTDVLPNRNLKLSGNYRKEYVPVNRKSVYSMAVSTFNGEMADSKRHGTWKYAGDDGQYFEGEFEHGKLIRGAGLLKDKYASYKLEFDGEWMCGEETRFSDNSVWTGKWGGLQNIGRGSVVWPNGQRYEGEWRYSTLHGQGILTHSDGTELEGEFRDGEIYRGHGTVQLSDGDYYEGSVVKGTWQGQGKLSLGGKLQVGEFREGRLLHGHGTYSDPDGWEYSGEVQDGLRHGQGRQTQFDKHVFEGTFKEGLIWEGRGSWQRKGHRLLTGEWTNGQFTGTISHAGVVPYRVKPTSLPVGSESGIVKMGIHRGLLNGTYIGAARRDKRHGQGKLTTHVGEVYEGEWLNDVLHGEGKLTFRNGSVYKGGWFLGKWDGSGRLTYKYGENKYVLEGTFKDNEIFYGRGTYFDAEGTKYEGEWSRGKLNGEATVTTPDGSTQRGVWVAGKRL